MPQGIQLIKTMAQPTYENPPFEERMIEMIKTSNGTNYQQQKNNELWVHYMIQETHRCVSNAMVNALNMIY